MCLEGARAVQEAILSGFPQLDVAVSIGWTNMLPLDNRFTARRAARTMPDPSVLHFHDPNKRAGRAVAASVGHAGKVGWDIYLFYAPGLEWGQGLPAPTRWAHQLDDAWAERAMHHTGRELVDALRAAMQDRWD